MCWDLCVAIRTGDLEQVRRLLDNGSSVHEEEGFFLADAWTPLQFAHHSVPMTRLLLDRGATLKPSDDEPRTAFHLASEWGHVDVVRFYLDRGTEVDLNGEDGSPLFFASKGGRQNVAQLLLDRGADVNIWCSLSFGYGRVDFNGGPLHVACYKGHFPMVQLLLEKGADPNSGGSFCTPLFWTCYSGSVEIARLLLESGAEMEDDMILNLCEAEIEEGRDENDFVDLLRFLLDQGADPDARADDDISTPLYNSCTNGHAGMARLLLDRGVDVDGDDKARPIQAACRECKEAVVRLLIDRGADVNAMEIRGEMDSDGQTPLHSALDWNYSKGGSMSRVVQLLLDHGADVNKATSTLKETALHFAWGIEQKEQEEGVFQMLLDRGANVNAKDCVGNTPLHSVCQMGQLEAAQMLLDRGAAVDSKNQHGKTPLHKVCCDGEENGLEIAKLLLDRGANVNAADEDGKTPLHLICDRSYNTNDYDNDFMQLLLDRGANVEAKTNDGLSPMYLACQRNALDIVWLLARQYPWLVMDQTSPTGERERKRQRMEQ